MVLLLQLNGELPDRFPGQERRIYIFSCRRTACRRRDGSIRALRGVRVYASQVPAKNEEEKGKESKKESKPVSGLGESIFGTTSLGGTSSANPFATSAANPFSSTSTTATNPFSSKPTSVPVNPFSTTSTQPTPPSSSPAKELPQTFAAALNINSPADEAPKQPPHETWPAESAQPPPYPVFWIAEAEYEVYDPATLTPLATIPLS